MTGFQKNQSEYTICCPICSANFVPKFTVYSEYDTPYLSGRQGFTLPLLSPVVLHKEFVNTLNKTGAKVLSSHDFVQDHSVVFWNLVLYFKVMKLPCFLLDLDYSKKHVKVQVSWILKYLPASASTSK